MGGPVRGVVDPLLGPLTENGGATLTHALLPGSPALNAGDPNTTAGVDDIPLYDQHGEGFRRVAGGRTDIGTLEVQDAGPAADFDRDGHVDGADFLIWQRDSISSSEMPPAMAAMPTSATDRTAQIENESLSDENTELRHLSHLPSRRRSTGTLRYVMTGNRAVERVRQSDILRQVCIEV